MTPINSLPRTKQKITTLHQFMQFWKRPNSSTWVWRTVSTSINIAPVTMTLPLPPLLPFFLFFMLLLPLPFSFWADTLASSLSTLQTFSLLFPLTLTPSLWPPFLLWLLGFWAWAMMTLVEEHGLGRVGERERREKELWVEEGEWLKPRVNALVRLRDGVCIFCKLWIWMEKQNQLQVT